ncbi:MAG: hypothetical protein H6Q51_1870, partial [Deltaproteobacteria bacterium]|nr:hypothetical protein [Deltaproteobacteria bacterium]
MDSLLVPAVIPSLLMPTAYS